MRTLVIETATSACSVALLDDDTLVAYDAAVVGRGHAERLMPMIAALPNGGRADRIWVDCGPGSFTGIRVGIAAARGLGFGWGVPVHGFSSMALIAAHWFAANVGNAVTVVIEGGHGEMFVQPFARLPFGPTADLQSIPAADVRVIGPQAGNTPPDARHAMLLGSADQPVRPIYGRGPDAKPVLSGVDGPMAA
jgi:tRNA threonylcarbamoyladenosine biosynthesis protein TsaB